MAERYNVDYIRTGYSRFDKLSDYDKKIITEDMARYMNLSINDIDDYQNWYYKNGRHFYFKKAKGLSSLLNELLGQDFSLYMGLPTVSYEIVENDDEEIIGLLSGNVRIKDVIYRPSRFLSSIELDYIKRVFMDGTFECDKGFKKDLTYYVVRNYFSSLRDRYMNSEVIVTEDGFQIPHLMDYESSYIDHLMVTYQDPMLTITFNPETIQILKENNEFFIEALELASSYKLIDAILRIEEKYRIVVPLSVKEYYKEFDCNRRVTMEYMGLDIKSKAK